MKEQTLADALAFLSLDALTPFADSLWLSPAIAEWRLKELRSQLEGPLCTDQYFTRFQSVCYEVFLSLQSDDKRHVWNSLFEWVSGVYLGVGHDRQTESLWSLIMAKHYGNPEQSNLPAKLRSHLLSVYGAIKMERARLSPHLGALTQDSLSSWDSRVLPATYMEIEFLPDKIELMATSNRLVTAWREQGRLSLAELCQLYDWAKGMAVELGVREIDVPFPGSWEYTMSQK